MHDGAKITHVWNVYKPTAARATVEVGKLRTKSKSSNKLEPMLSKINTDFGISI